MLENWVVAPPLGWHRRPSADKFDREVTWEAPGKPAWISFGVFSSPAPKTPAERNEFAQTCVSALKDYLISHQSRLYTGPKLEEDQRFLARINARYSIGKRPACNHTQLYRAVQDQVVRCSIVVVSTEPAEIGPVLEEGIRMLLNAAPAIK